LVASQLFPADTEVRHVWQIGFYSSCYLCAKCGYFWRFNQISMFPEL
jgi:hypothetical protein